MLSTMSAEALKLRRHRATWLLVWIFPIGVLLISIIAIAFQMAQTGPQETSSPSLQSWLDNNADFWDAPPSSFVRFLIIAFVAMAFAGEYRWNTWKLIVPHRARGSLIAAKYVVTLALLYASFLAAAIIMGLSGWVEDVATGDQIPQGITLGGMANAHWTGFLAGLPTVLFTVALASFAAIVLRSTTGALITGIMVVTLEQLFVNFGPLLAVYLPGLTEALYQLLPGYHLANLANWMTQGSARSVQFMTGEAFAYGWGSSLAIVAAWTIGLVGLTFWRFGRQDIN